jgi:hypothetical protein
VTVLRWAIFSVLTFIGGWAIMANWVIAFRRRGSHIPVLGGVIVAVAFAIVPWESLRNLWWVPLIADLGCLPMLLLVGSYLAWRSIFGKQE